MMLQPAPRSKWRVSLPYSAAVALLMLAIAGIGATTYLVHSGMHQATARVVLTPSKPAATDTREFNPAPELLFFRGIDSYTTLMNSESFLRRVIDNQQLPLTPGQLRNQLAVSSPRQSMIVDITVRDRDGDVAVRSARGIADEFTHTLPELEKPTPIGAMELGPVGYDEAYPNELSRVIILSVVASLIVVLGSVVVRRRRPHTPPDNADADANSTSSPGPTSAPSPVLADKIAGGKS